MFKKLITFFILSLTLQAFAQESCQQRVARLEYQNLLLTQALANAGGAYPAELITHECRSSCMLYSSKVDSRGRWKRRIAVTGYGGSSLKEAFESLQGECQRNLQIWAEKEPTLTGLRSKIIRVDDYDDAPAVTSPAAVCTRR